MSDWDARLASDADNSFDAMRLLLASLVVLEHSYYLVDNSFRREPLFVFSGGQTDFGSVAVNLFFVLSGFLITRSWQLTNNPTRYMQKRIARIVPGYLAVCALTIIIAISYSTERFNLATIVRILTFQGTGMDAFPDNPTRHIAATLWTIRHEFECYLLVAALGLVGLLNKITAVFLFVTLAVVYLLQLADLLTIPSITYGITWFLISNPENWPRLFTYFWAGAAFYLWRDHIPKSSGLAALSVAAILAALLFGGANVVLIGAGTYLLLWVALSTQAVPKVFGRRTDISYGVYLFGCPIQQIFIANSPGISPEMLFFSAFPATACVAYLSWISIESPSIRYRWPQPLNALKHARAVAARD